MSRHLDVLNRKERRALRAIEGGREERIVEVNLNEVVPAIDVRTGKQVVGAKGPLTLGDVVLISLRTRLERDQELGGKEKTELGLMIQRLRGVEKIDITAKERDTLLRRCELVIDHPEVYVETCALLNKGWETPAPPQAAPPQTAPAEAAVAPV